VSVRYYNVEESLTLLAAIYSRTFGVCACCPHGGHLPGMGTRATRSIEDDTFGIFRLCDVHADGLSAVPAHLPVSQNDSSAAVDER
jgi:uncharacterized Ntn-hydrolase superfamily protein